MTVHFSQGFLMGWFIVNMFTLSILAVIACKWVVDFIEWVTGDWIEWL